MPKEWQLECHHFANPKVVVYLGSVHQRLLKPLGERLIGIKKTIVDGSD